MRRDVPWDRIVRGVLAVSGHAADFCRRGQDGDGRGGRGGSAGRLPDRAALGFFQRALLIDTMNRRPLVNTRDEPHADAASYRRFHVIVGDANMSQWATALKIGHDGAGAGSDRARPRAAVRTRPSDRGDEIDQPRSELRLDHRADATGGRFPRSTSSGSTSRGARALRRNGRGNDVAAREWEHVLDDLAARRDAWRAIGSTGWRRSFCSTLCRKRRSWSGAIRGCSRSTSNTTTSIARLGLYYELMREGRCGGS